jgi:hypothetical protein
MRTRLGICTEADYLDAHLTAIAGKACGANTAAHNVRLRVTSILKQPIFVAGRAVSSILRGVHVLPWREPPQSPSWILRDSFGRVSQGIAKTKAYLAPLWVNLMRRRDSGLGALLVSLSGRDNPPEYSRQPDSQNRYEDVGSN